MLIINIIVICCVYSRYNSRYYEKKSIIIKIKTDIFSNNYTICMNIKKINDCESIHYILYDECIKSCIRLVAY